MLKISLAVSHFMIIDTTDITLPATPTRRDMLGFQPTPRWRVASITLDADHQTFAIGGGGRKGGR